MSNSERPELRAFRELEELVAGLAEELASFRRRALVAEARLREIDDRATADGAPAGPPPSARIAELEHENAELRERVEFAAGRTRQMLDRVHFLRQQTQGAER